MDDIAGKSVLLWDLVVHQTNVSTVLVYFINVFPDQFMLVQPFNNCSIVYWGFMGSQQQQKDLACGIILAFDRNVNFCQDH